MKTMNKRSNKNTNNNISQQPFPMNFVDEQSGERCHKIYKFVRPHLARQTSPEDNLYDLMKAALARSDPKIACLAVKNAYDGKRTRKDDDFERKMNEYTVPSICELTSADNCGDNDDHFEWTYSDESGSDTESDSDSDC